MSKELNNLHRTGFLTSTKRRSMQNQTGMGLDRIMCQMQKNAQSFEVIFGVSEKSITERQNG